MFVISGRSGIIWNQGYWYSIMWNSNRFKPRSFPELCLMRGITICDVYALLSGVTYAFILSFTCTIAFMMNVHVHAVNRYDPTQYALKAQCMFRDRTVLQLSCLMLDSIHVCRYRLQITCTFISKCMYVQCVQPPPMLMQSENILLHNMNYVPTSTFNNKFSW